MVVGLGRPRRQGRHARGFPGRLAGHRRRNAGAVRRAAASPSTSRPAMATEPGCSATTPSSPAATTTPTGTRPASTGRSTAIIAAFDQAGVKHVFWVTLREVKPQYITAGAWKQVQPYYWYFPTVNEHLRAGARPPSRPVADRLGVGRRPARADLRRHPPQPVRRSRVRGNIARATWCSAAVKRAAGRFDDHEITVAGIGGVPADAKAVSLNLTVTNPRTVRASSPPIRATSPARRRATSTSSATRRWPGRRSSRLPQTERCACTPDAANIWSSM